MDFTPFPNLAGIRLRVFRVSLVLSLSMVCCERRGLFGPAVILCSILSLHAQSPAQATAKAMELTQTRYQVKVAEPVPISAPSDTIDFLRNATSRAVTIGNTKAAGLVVGPNRAGQIVLAASPLAKPGEYTVTVSATSAAGETRQASVTAVVSALTPVPSGSSRNPVVLLNGWEEGFAGTCVISSSITDTFGNLAQYLLADGVPEVFLFDNCAIDPNQTVETLGNDLAAFLQSIKYDSGAQVPQIDLVGFSLGGLVARAYLAGLQPDQVLLPPATTLVGKLVLIATPNFGSFLAGNNSGLATTLGPQSTELIPGSSFLWNLSTWNQFSDDLRGVNTVAVIGNAGQFVPSISSTTALNNASDGIVSLASASAGFATKQASVTRIVPYCHVDPSVFADIALGAFNCNAAGIANVTSEAHYTGEIVRSFLAGTSDWASIGTTPATDPYLSKDGGTFFALVSESNSYASDLTSVAWGNSQMVNGGDAGTIYYDDFASGTAVFDASSTSLGTLNCQSYTQPAGYFYAYRCKVDAAIVSVGPLVTTFPRVVSAGGIITIAGADFGGQCSGCRVTASVAGSTTAQNLVISSWKTTAIAAALPANLTGLIIITVFASTGTDSVAIMSAVSNPSVIAVSPATLAFNYTTGGSVPAAASVQITNSGSGTLAWTATASAAWLTVAPASGTAPSALSVSLSPAGLSPNTYTGNVLISASGASNTPFSIAVTLTVTQAPPALAISPQALTFNYSVGGSLPAVQTVAITNAGAGTLSFTAAASSSPYWLAVSPSSGSAPGTLSVSINPANLAPGTYSAAVQVTAAGATGSPTSIAITLVVQGTQPAGTITAVGNASSFQSGVASATWIAILGSNLSANTYTWQASDFVNGMLPTSLQGVSVTIDGLPAYVEYISPTQINVLAPDDTATGPVQVQVTAAQQASNSLTVQKSAFFPALFTIDNGKYVAALHLDYSLVGNVGLLPGVPSSPAQPGETIAIYATGFGPTNPVTPTAQLVASPAPLANPVQVTIGGVSAAVTYAGLVGPGTYQLNVTVPKVPAGDMPVVATIGNFTTTAGVSVTVQQ
jgi:uncharacterized protein (TIGR03437 family)